MSEYIKLKEAPQLVINYPTCSACTVDLVSEDGWICPVCGTFWQYDAGDGDTGDLYVSWSGEKLDSEPVDESAAFHAGIAYERAEREALLARVRARSQR